jgi:hypothetical protein
MIVQSMSARPSTPDQVERWFKRTCARCGRHAYAAGRWPEGALCRTCYSHALDTFGRCADCGVGRMVPGLAASSGRLCTECAGIPGDFICRRCNVEGRRYSRGLCPRCFLTEQLAELLDDGSGSIRPGLVPLFDAGRTMPKPCDTFYLGWICRRCLTAACLLDILAVYATREDAESDLLSEDHQASFDPPDPLLDAVAAVSRDA